MFKTASNTILRGSLVWFLRLGSLFALFALPAQTMHVQSATLNYLHTSGNQILDASGRVVGLSGVNWFGFETSNYAPHGLWSRNWGEMLDQIKNLGYNVIRLPYSNAMLTSGTMPNGIDYVKNPDLAGLTSLQVMDRIIAGAGARGLRIILDNHRSTPGGGPESSGLWYTSGYSESRWLKDWKMLVNRYNGNDIVVAVDLRNEPFNACWGCNDSSKDWRLAAEKAGNAILSINPNLLIIVEGVAIYNNQSTWWGGNLIGAKNFPVRLRVANRLVYSPHEYSASMYPHPWFSDPTYPQNLPAVWDKYWGYLSKNTPILIGEFGTRLETEKDRQWFTALQSYIQSNKLNWTFWSLNPNSGDTGGLLLDDWVSVHQEKQSVLKMIQYPLLGLGTALNLPTATLPPAPTPTVTVTPVSTTPTILVLDDFESGSLQSWGAFQSSDSFFNAGLVSPGQNGNFAMKADYNIGSAGWAGIGKTFAAASDWSPYQRIRFAFYGVNNGAAIRFEILNNPAVGISGDTFERFEYRFSDNFNGWRTFDLSWNDFPRRADWQPANAPNDGFNLGSIWGYNFSPIYGQGSFQLDDIQLIK